MGPGFVLIFWLFIAGVFAVIWAAAVGLFILSSLKKWRVLKWLSGIATGGLTAIGLLIVGLFTYGIIRSMDPSAVFENTFHRAPASNVRNLQSKVFWFADTGSTYLRFETDAETFRSLVPSELPRITHREYLDKGWHGSDPGPDWWTYDFPASAEIHLKTTGIGEGKRFASEMALMVYVPEERVAYYHFIGID